MSSNDSSSHQSRGHQTHHQHHQNRRGQGHHHDNRGHGKGQQRSNLEQSEVDALFSRAFTFQKPDGPWKLPSTEALFTDQGSVAQDDWNQGLSDLRSKLRSTQDHLSDKEILEWHAHTASTHRGGLVIPELKKRFHVELGTQAWCKFHEIVATRLLIPDSAFVSGTLHSLHICEAPGAFISSLNHYIKTHRDKEIAQWKWLGTSLNPHCETNTADCTIVDDRLILQTPDCWYFGEDNTGDVMSSANLAGLERLIQRQMNGTVHLVTADGSVNCQNDPEHQEQRVFPLLFCQSLTALQILAPGGSFLIKMFTMYNANTACLMYLLNCAFKEVTVVKPACSKAGNSEVYVMCKSFLGREQLQPQLETLLKHFGPEVGKTPLFSPSNLPDSFTTQLEKCSLKFTNYQVAAIEENLKLYLNMDVSSRQRIDRVREYCVQTFIKRCRLRAARKHQKLMPNYGSKSSSMFAKNMWHRLHGSLEEREEEGHRSWKEQLLSIQRSLQQPGAKPVGPGGDRQNSSPKELHGSVEEPHPQDASPLQGSDSHQSNTERGSRFGGGDDASDLPGGPGPESTGPTMQDDQPSVVDCHGEGDHIGISGSTMRTCEMVASLMQTSTPTNVDDDTEMDACSSACPSIMQTRGNGDHFTINDSTMEADDSKQGASNLAQISSEQKINGATGIVGDITAMDVESPGISTNPSLDEHAKSDSDQAGSASVSHPDESQTANSTCDTFLQSKQAKDPNISKSDISTSHTEAEGCCQGDSDKVPLADQEAKDDGQCVGNGASGGQGSPTKETTKGKLSEIFTVQIPWIAPGNHESDTLGSWKIVTGHPVRAVFMSPFCQIQLLDKWRTVRRSAKVLQQTTDHNIKGHPQNDLSPQILEVIEDHLSKRPVSRCEEWYCYGMSSHEMDSLHHLATSHNAAINSRIDGYPIGDVTKDLQHLLQRQAQGKRSFKSLFFKLLPSCTARKTEPTAAEVKMKHDFISACLLTMKELQMGGSLHIWVPSLLTRFSACIVYILSQTFDLLTLVKGQGSDGLAAPPVLINCTGFHPNPQIEKNIQRAYERMEELHQEGSHDVLQFVPMLSLFNPDFDKALTRFNENFLREDTLRIVETELAFLDNQGHVGGVADSADEMC